jgi:hypothetical protein
MDLDGICNEAYIELLTQEFHPKGDDFNEVVGTFDHKVDYTVGVTSLDKFI